MKEIYFISIDFKKLSEEEQQVAGCEATITYGDGNGNVLERHNYKETDFPLDELRLYFIVGFIQKKSNRTIFFVNLNLNKTFKMDIQTTKLKLLKAILDDENPEFIQRVSDFVKKEKIDFWKELSLSEQKEIKKGIEDLDSGKRISYDSFLKKIP